LYIIRAGKLLSVFHVESVLTAICATVVSIGVYGAMVGTYPVLHNFGFIFFTMAGLCFQISKDWSAITEVDK